MKADTKTNQLYAQFFPQERTYRRKQVFYSSSFAKKKSVKTPVADLTQFLAQYLIQYDKLTSAPTVHSTVHDFASVLARSLIQYDNKPRIEVNPEIPVTKLEHIDIKEIHDDLLNGCGKKALEVFNNIRVSVEDGLNLNSDFISELSKLDELQSIFGILKSTDYEKNTLNYQIYDRIQNKIVNLANKIKNRDEDIDILFSEIAEILQTYSNTKGALKETGIDKLSTIKDLGIKIGEKRVFQIE